MDIDFIQLIQRRNEVSNEWWGYSIKNGWVMLNRKLLKNGMGRSKNDTLTFIRCSDWTEFEDVASNWTAPNYIYGVPYLKQLKDEKLKQAYEQLFEIFSYYKENKQHIKGEQLKREDKLRFESLQARHNNYLESKGLSKQELIKNTNSYRRINHCWNCLSTVDNNTDYECKGCGWIVCGSCGACEKPTCSNKNN
jgi:hypothetical protein